MKKIIILIPVYNDWESLNKLIFEISLQIKNFKEYHFDFVVVNDGSVSKKPEINIPKNINSIEILNMKQNRGHTACIPYGIYHVLQNKNFNKLILMDGDGEDRPEEILELINKNVETNKSVVAKRVKRSEGVFFKIFYKIHKLITLIFTGQNINFGNFTLLQKEDLHLINKKKSLWRSYSGTFKKYIKDYQTINSTRGHRYFGPSKMSFFKLVIHSLSIIATFKYVVFLRSSFMVIILAYLINYLENLSIVFQILIVIFNLLIFIVSLKKNDLKDSSNNLDNIENISH